MIDRRRVLTILAGAAALGLTGGRAIASVSQWRGIALGAEARIILDHPDADRLITIAVAEINRLEDLFSLYRPNSQISRLNRDGVLNDPAFEMIELMSMCSGLNHRTGGAFDPTVQPLWALYARAFASGSAPQDDAIKTVMAKTGWQHVVFSAKKIQFSRSDMAMTFNGIAQGFIADKVVDVLRKAGIRDVLVNTGEISGLGNAPDGSRWKVKLGGNSGQSITLRNAAVATSATLGTTFDQAGRRGHILDPRTGYPGGGGWSQVSVVAKSAATADGLSTAFCLMDADEISAATGDETVYLS